MPKVNESYHQERRQYILSCMHQVLDEKLLKDITMKDVIKKAGFSQGTIYNYYNNVDEIINTLICHYMIDMKEKLSKSIVGVQGFMERYHRMCQSMISLYEEEHQLFEMVLGNLSYHSVSKGDEDVLYHIYQSGEELNAIIVDVLQDGIAEGIVREDLNLLVAVFYLWSGIGNTIIFSHSKKQYIEEQFQLSRQEYMEQGFELVIRSVLR